MSGKRGIIFFLVGFSALAAVLTWFPVPTRADNSLILLEDINPGSEPSWTKFITDVDGTVFFTATSLVPGQTTFYENRLWATDGTPGSIWGGTWMVDGSFLSSVVALNPSELVNFNGTLFFSADGINFDTNPDTYFGRELWRSDGTSLGTFMVNDIVSGSGGSYPTNLVSVGALLFFAANGANGAGNELWVTDGIPFGITTMVRDIKPGLPGSIGKIAAPVDVNGTLFFWADDGTHGFELWKSDGSPSGTVMVKDINPMAGVSSTSFDPNPSSLLGSRRDRIFNPINLNGTLYFTADDGTHGVELWKSDGTTSGTVMVADINTSPTVYGGDSTPGWLTEMNGDLYFTAYGTIAGRELRKLDTGTGVVSVVDNIRPGSLSSRDQALDDVLVAINGTLFFSANDGTNGYALWSTDGTALGTSMVADIDPRNDGWAAVSKLIRVGNTLFFAASDNDGVELWSSDGTFAGTSGTDVYPGLDPWGSPNSSITLITGPRGIDFVASDGRLFAPLNGGTYGDELWATIYAAPIGFDPGRIRILAGGTPLLPQPGADVTVTVAASREPVGTDQLFSYAISVKNKGPKKIATGVKVTDTLPAGTSFLWEGGALFVPPACSSALGVVTCDVGNLAKGKTAKFTLIVQAPTVTGTINNLVDVTSKSADPNHFNDSDFALTTVVVANPGVDVSITKDVVLNPVFPGTPIIFDLNVFNGGAADASGVVMTDVLPAGVSFVAVDSTPTGLCQELTGTVTCNIGALASGASTLISIMGTAPITEGTVLNTASVTSTEPDTNPTNNQAQVRVSVPEPSSSVLTLVALITIIALAERNRRYAEIDS